MSAVEAGTLGTFVDGGPPRRAEPSMPAASPSSGRSDHPLSAGLGREPEAGRRRRARRPMDRKLHVPGRAAEPPDGDLGERRGARCEAADFPRCTARRPTINGQPAWVGFYTGRLQDLGVVIVEAAHVVLGDHVYLVAGVAPWPAYETVRHEFFATDQFVRQRTRGRRRPAVDRALVPLAERVRPRGMPRRRLRLPRGIRGPHAGQPQTSPSGHRPVRRLPGRPHRHAAAHLRPQRRRLLRQLALRHADRPADFPPADPALRGRRHGAARKPSTGGRGSASPCASSISVTKREPACGRRWTNFART